jgi:hypothetical protein
MITRAPAVAAAFVLLSSVAMAQQPSSTPAFPDHARGIVAATRFSTTASLSAANGTAQSFRLSLGSLWLSGGRRIEVPPQGFYVATLVTSDVVTVIGGREVTRHTGDSWSVPSGASMIVQLQGRSEGALLDIFRVEPNPPAR